jgi:hypothetical protein
MKKRKFLDESNTYSLASKLRNSFRSPLRCCSLVQFERLHEHGLLLLSQPPIPLISQFFCRLQMLGYGKARLIMLGIERNCIVAELKVFMATL